MIQFLEDRKFLQERVNAGVDVHPSEIELKEFQKLAIQISPNQDFSYRGCLDCVNYMVKFVFDNADRLEAEPMKTKKMTFPKQEPPVKPEFPKDRIG